MASGEAIVLVPGEGRNYTVFGGVGASFKAGAGDTGNAFEFIEIMDLGEGPPPISTQTRMRWPTSSRASSTS